MTAQIIYLSHDQFERHKVNGKIGVEKMEVERRDGPVVWEDYFYKGRKVYIIEGLDYA